MEKRGENSRATTPNYRHIELDEIDSTNAECLRLAKNGDEGNLWVTSKVQNSGRGRRGREWMSESGNLFASLLLINVADLRNQATLPLAVAVAVHRAIEAEIQADVRGLQIKWPNDLLLNGKKLCGILIEVEKLANGTNALAIGVGVNVSTAPNIALYPTTSLVVEGYLLNAENLFARLYKTMSEELEIWDGGRGLHKTLAAWRLRACGIGQPIKVNLPNETVKGVFFDIDDTGQLILKDSMGKFSYIAAGDVFFEN